MTKKPTIKAEKRKALKAMSDYIRERDRWTCYTCGKCGLHDENRASKFDAGHLISRYWAATLFDEMNIKCQCKGCNILHEQDPEIYRRLWIQEHSAAGFEELYRKSKEVVRRRVQDYIEIREYFEGKLKDIKEE